MSGLRNEWLVNEVGEDEDIYNLIPETDIAFTLERFWHLNGWVKTKLTVSILWVSGMRFTNSLNLDSTSLVSDIGLLESFNEDYLMNYIDIDSLVCPTSRVGMMTMLEMIGNLFSMKMNYRMSTEQKERHEELDQEIEELIS